jgi:hypothetical protein
MARSSRLATQPQATASDSVRLVVVGDVGEGNLAQSLVARTMSDKCRAVGGCNAVIMTGDNFYEDGVGDTADIQFFAKFEEPYNLPGLDIPFYVVLGNHDVRSDWRPQVEYSMLPTGDGPRLRPSARWTMPARWYDVVMPAADESRNLVHLFAFDTTSYYDSQQASDMSGRVATSESHWKISFAHHPRYTSGAHHFDNPELGAAGMYSLQEAVFCGTDLFISGHDHNTEFIEKGRHGECPDTHFAISGAGSKVRSSRAPKDPKSLYFDDEAPAFAYLEITADELHFEFIDMCGNKRFEKDITK